MNNRIISVVTDPGVGGTFLSWTLHYLNGHKKYFHHKSNSWKSVTDQPLTKINSHGFSPNQPASVNYSQAFISALSNADTEDFHVLYFHNFEKSDSDEHANWLQDIQKNSSLNKRRLFDSLPKTYKAMIDASSDCIVLTTNENHNLYFSKFDKRNLLSPSFTDSQKKLETNEEFWNDFTKHFFNKDQSWHYSNLTNIWDRREFLALNIRPNQVIKILKNIELTKPHFLLDTYELYNLFDKTVIQLFDYLKLTIDQNRKDNWHSVYKQWQLLHLDRILFSWYFDQIIDYTLNNHYMDLSRFNLDLIQEACIQHHLIYKHNLNLKGWQLEKFSNTKQLHNLLEPNIHSLN